jgi:hypothetical protein
MNRPFLITLPITVKTYDIDFLNIEYALDCGSGDYRRR